MRLCRNIAFGVSVLLVMFEGASCFGNDDSTGQKIRRLTEFLPEVVRDKGAPGLKKFTPLVGVCRSSSRWKALPLEIKFT
jgi:hypothetical protein